MQRTTGSKSPLPGQVVICAMHIPVLTIPGIEYHVSGFDFPHIGEGKELNCILQNKEKLVAGI